MNYSILEGGDVINGITPVDLTLADNVGDWVNLANAARALVVLVAGIGVEDEDPILQLEQAQSASGAGAKALNFERLKYKVGELLSGVQNWTEVERTADDEYDTAGIDGGENELIVAVEIEHGMLDGANGFTWIRAKVPQAGAGDDPQLGTVYYVVAGRSYKSDNPKTVIA